jgi:acyl carrier protein
MSNVQERVLKILRSVGRGALPSPLDPEQSLFDSAVLDSFALPELVTALEQEFAISIPDADLTAQTFESLRRIVSYVDKKI